MNNVDLLLVIAAVLFIIAGVMRTFARAFDAALIAGGLACFVLAFLVNP